LIPQKETIMNKPNEPNAQTHSDLSSGASAVRHELADDAARLKHAAEDRAGEKLESGKHKAAHAAESAASALGQAADTLRDNEQAPDWLAGAIETTASRISHFARAIDGRSVADIRNDINHFAREHPASFLAASAAAGFAAARFLHAGAAYKAHHKVEGKVSAGSPGSSPGRTQGAGGPGGPSFSQNPERASPAEPGRSGRGS
jgi:hypothetical protein